MLLAVKILWGVLLVIYLVGLYVNHQQIADGREWLRRIKLRHNEARDTLATIKTLKSSLDSLVRDELTLKQIAKKSTATTFEKGFHDRHRDPPELIALIHAELSEALEETRKNSDLTHTYYREDGKPEGFVVEVADTLLRMLDMIEYNDLTDLFLKAVEEKMAFNATRPRLHGKLF